MIFDIVIATVIIYFAIKYYHEGLINSLILLVSKFIIFLSAFLVAGRYAGDLSEKYVSDKIYGYVDSIIVKSFDFNGVFESLQNKISTSNSEIVELLLDASGTDIDRLILSGSETAISVMRDSVTNSISYGFTYIVVFIATLIVASVAVSLLMSFVDFIFVLPMFGAINKIGGVLLGALTGFLVSSLIIWTIITVMPVTTMEDGILNSQTIEDTYIVKHVCNLTPSAIVSLIY